MYGHVNQITYSRFHLGLHDELNPYAPVIFNGSPFRAGEAGIFTFFMHSLFYAKPGYMGTSLWSKSCQKPSPNPGGFEYEAPLFHSTAGTMMRSKHGT